MKILNYFMLAAIAIPLDLSQWQTLKYSSIPEHKLSNQNSSMIIDVQSSAMPLIYPLKEKPIVKSICIKGERSGNLKLTEAKLQGEKDLDDFVIRIGLVEKGSERLNWFQRKVAASWVNKLFSLAGEEDGINKINFYTAVQDKSLIGKTRDHPLGKELMKESNVWVLDKSQKKFLFEHKLSSPLETLALWLSVDGDDTQSSYQLTIESIQLNCLSDSDSDETKHK